MLHDIFGLFTLSKKVIWQMFRRMLFITAILFSLPLADNVM